MGPGIVQRMGALVYRVISAGRCVPVRSTVYKAGKYVLFTGCNQLLPRVGNLENHFILFRERNRYCEVEVFFGEKNDRLRGLIDTGNTLSDTISNDPVSIIDRASVRRLTEEKKPERFRYISYHSIGKKEGVMPAFRLDKMQIIRDGNKINVEHPLVAVSEEELGSENYQMIINPDILTGGKKNGDKSGSSTSV